MKVGILGAGNIATKMAATLNMMKATQADVEAYAVASRDLAKSKAFAAEYKVARAYGSYEDLFNDPAVDLVYVATPHSHHYAQMKDALSHGKNILCEKAFTLNAAQAKEVLELAKQKKRLVAEAIWTRYMPMRKTLDEILAKGLIGQPRALTANLAYPEEQVERLVKPELAGGALLDLGVYVINFALMTFGTNIKKIDSTMIPYKTGVDAMSSVTLTYEDGKMAILHTSMQSRGDRRGVVMGSEGYAEFFNINNCEGIKVFDTEDKLKASFETPKQLTGFEYQVEACRKAIEVGSIECPDMPHSEIIRVMEIMDGLRKQWGFRYPEEK
jgi:predicted dehydrogenase